MSRSAAAALLVQIGEQRWQVHLEQAFDLSIPLAFDQPQPVFFGVAPATEQPLQSGSFTGDVRRGGSCNCSTYAITPHCQGTHTECVGHLTAERISVRDVAIPPLLPALVVTVRPQDARDTSDHSDPLPLAGDELITRAALESAARPFLLDGCGALVVRTLPNPQEKIRRNYDDHPAAYFSMQSMQWLIEHDIAHLVVDLPSVDRAQDAGRLTAHRIFWGMPSGSTRAADARRSHATITELAYVDRAVADGHYMLNLQIAPFLSDAAPSRPLLYPRTLP